MNTLVVYASKKGSTEKAAKMLFEKLEGEKSIVNIKENSSPTLENYETVILGGSIYAGSIQKEIKNFVNDNLNLLLTKKIGLFLCCGMEENYKKQLKQSFPEELLDHSITDQYFGFEYNKEKMNLIEKTLIKLVTKSQTNLSNILKDNIDKLAMDIQGDIKVGQ
ncbi:MAG: flavodoxin domain-containing protein [Halanaerobiales bacterium]|nr:flavodoxin domain-containing protein [Halanaerobiales bacterium]